jgi:hypothetical protein
MMISRLKTLGVVGGLLAALVLGTALASAAPEQETNEELSTDDTDGHR